MDSNRLSTKIREIGSRSAEWEVLAVTMGDILGLSEGDLTWLRAHAALGDSAAGVLSDIGAATEPESEAARNILSFLVEGASVPEMDEAYRQARSWVEPIR